MKVNVVWKMRKEAKSRRLPAGSPIRVADYRQIWREHARASFQRKLHLSLIIYHPGRPGDPILRSCGSGCHIPEFSLSMRQGRSQIGNIFPENLKKDEKRAAPASARSGGSFPDRLLEPPVSESPVQQCASRTLNAIDRPGAGCAFRVARGALRSDAGRLSCLART